MPDNNACSKVNYVYHVSCGCVGRILVYSLHSVALPPDCWRPCKILQFFLHPAIPPR